MCTHLVSNINVYIYHTTRFHFCCREQKRTDYNEKRVFMYHIRFQMFWKYNFLSLKRWWKVFSLKYIFNDYRRISTYLALCSEICLDILPILWILVSWIDSKMLAFSRLCSIMNYAISLLASVSYGEKFIIDCIGT